MSLVRAGAIVALVLALGLSQGASGAKPEQPQAETLRSRVFVVFDKKARAIVRKRYSVWAAPSSANMDFDWTPHRASAGDSELINGRGELVWREGGTASYDRRAAVSRYRGEMKAGRPHGRGELRTRSGVRYEGTWRDGRYDGKGELQLPNGTSYEGAFKAGFFDGDGTLVQADDEIHEGPFVNGRKHGVGRTRLPSGVTYRSSWSNGVEDPETKLLRVAQTGPTVPASAAETLRIGLQVEQTEGGFIATTKPDRVSIAPDYDDLVRAWRQSGPMLEAPDIEILDVPDMGVLLLNVSINNTSATAADVTRSYLEVDESLTDKQPLYGMTVPGPFACNDGRQHIALYNTMLSFRNFGWGEPSATKIEFAFSNVEGASLDKPATLKTEVFSATVPSTAGDLRYEAAPIFERLGVNLADFKSRQSRMGPSDDDIRALPKAQQESAKLKDAFDCQRLADEQCRDKIAASGKLGRLSNAVSLREGVVVTTVAGRLTYRYKDAKGSERSYVAPFETLLALGARAVPWCSEGGEGPAIDPGAVFRAPFTLDKSKYQIALPFKGAVAAGKNRALRLALRSAKSSEHRFRVVLELKGGQVVRSKLIDLLAFVPHIEPGNE